MKTKHPKQKLHEIHDYDDKDVSGWVNPVKPLKFVDLGLELPKTPPTQVVSLRLPSQLLNEIKALGSQQDIPYQALIKLFLAESLLRAKKRLG